MIELEGKQYEMSDFTQEVQDVFQKYCEGKMYKVLTDNKDKLSTDEYTKMLQEHFFKVAAGQYNIFDFMDKNEHVAHLFWLLLRRCQVVDEQEIKSLYYRQREIIIPLLMETLKKNT